MIIIKCDKTGIEFEASSKRQKNHPLISRLLNEAASDKHNGNAYSVALAACAEVKKLGGMTIDEAVTLINRRLSGNSEDNDAARQAEAQRKREEAARREVRHNERKARNAFLREHGYQWSKEYADFDEFEEGEPSEWVLRAPNGRVVDVAQALDEINRGATVVLEEVAQQEQLAAEKVAQKEAAEKADRQALADAKSRVRAFGREVSPFNYAGFAVIYDRRRNEICTIIDTVYVGQINGVECGVIYHYFGGHDFDERTSYYCADPVTAGLEALHPTTGTETLNLFFGG